MAIFTAPGQGKDFQWFCFSPGIIFPWWLVVIISLSPLSSWNITKFKIDCLSYFVLKIYFYVSNISREILPKNTKTDGQLICVMYFLLGCLPNINLSFIRSEIVGLKNPTITSFSVIYLQTQFRVGFYKLFLTFKHSAIITLCKGWALLWLLY